MTREIFQKTSTRIRVMEFLFGVAILLIAGRAVMLQLFDTDQLTGLADKDLMTQVDIQGKRGDILDRNMKKLSTSLDAISIAAAPEDILDPQQAARTLAPLLQMDETVLTGKFSSGKKFVWLKKKLSTGEADKITALKIRGILPLKDTIRFHPNRELAAQVIGITGWDDLGKEGLEFKFDSQLKGRTERIRIKKNALKKIEEKTRALRGESLVLTLDKTIQYIAEMALKKAVIDNDAKSGMAIVMHPGTGEVLAMAHFPVFNPNVFGEFDPKIWRNRAVTDAFEPGSTLKIFLAAGALDQGISSPDTPFFCENGAFRVRNKIIRDTHSYGWLTLGQIVQVSSNIGVTKVAMQMGSNRLHTTLTRFGFGEKTGIACPIETQGSLMPPGKWMPMDTAAIAFGQGIAVSAIQLAGAVSTIANKGIRMEPRLVRSVLKGDGSLKKRYSPTRLGRAVSENTARDVTRMMRSVVQKGGTGTRADLPGYNVCGKTGTAQKAKRFEKGYSDTAYTAVFVGFAPQNDPQLTVVVIVDEPQRHHYGGVVAAPAFKTILEKSFNYLNIAPDMKQVQSMAPGAGGA